MNVAGFSVSGGDWKHELKSPTAVFITQDQAMFIFDAGNFRVQRWKQGEPLGFTVAGNGKNDTSLNSISYGYGLFVDDNNNIYVSEYENHRITFWVIDERGGGSLVSRVDVKVVIEFSSVLLSGGRWQSLWPVG